MEHLDALKAFYRLPEQEFNIIQARVIKKYTRNKTPVSKPTAIIIGGQPGSGKSELIIEALHLLKDNAVVCNADDFRDFHPKADEIKQMHERFYPEITADYSQPWNDALMEHCENNGFNYILETTFSSGDRMNDTIAQIKAKGYRVIIMLLAIPAPLSILGTHIRFEEMKRIEGVGRLVDLKTHQDKFLAIPGTLQKVQEAGLYENLYIYGRRNIQRKSISKTGVNLIAHNPADPVKTYLQERDKELSAEYLNYFYSARLNVLEMMIKRGAGLPEVKAFLKNSKFDDMDL